VCVCSVGTPRCRGDSELVSGDSASMRCEVQLAGTFKPALRWTREGSVVPSTDDSDIGMALLAVSVDAVGPDDDKAVYQCEMRVGDVIEDSCSIKLDVHCEFISFLLLFYSILYYIILFYLFVLPVAKILAGARQLFFGWGVKTGYINSQNSLCNLLCRTAKKDLSDMTLR